LEAIVSRIIRAVLALAALFCSVNLRAQDVATGLGRIYFQPAPGQLDQFLAAEVLREKLPVILAGTEQTADCVMAWVTGPANLELVPAKKPSKETGQFVLLDLHAKSVSWGLRLREEPFSEMKDKAERKLAAEVIGKMRHDGAFCGGAPFATPMQSAEDRVKGFKPPVFEVPW
jgi:hypothetical protein